MKKWSICYLLKNFNFGTLKVMKTCLVIRFLAVICPGIRFFWEILPGLGFALATHPYLLLLGSRLPPRIQPVVTWMLDKNTCTVFTNTTCFNSYMTLNNCPSILYYSDEKEAFVSSIKTCTQAHTPDNKPRWNLTDLLYFNGQFQPWRNLTPWLQFCWWKRFGISFRVCFQRYLLARQCLL